MKCSIQQFSKNDKDFHYFLHTQLFIELMQFKNTNISTRISLLLENDASVVLRHFKNVKDSHYFLHPYLIHDANEFIDLKNVNVSNQNEVFLACIFYEIQKHTRKYYGLKSG